MSIYIVSGSEETSTMSTDNNFLTRKGWFILDQVLIYKSPGFSFNSLGQKFTFFDFDNVVINYTPEIHGKKVDLVYTDNIEKIPKTFIVVSNKGVNLRYFTPGKRKNRLREIQSIFQEADKRFQKDQKREYLVLLPLEDVIWAKPMPTTWEVFIRPYIGNRTAEFVGDAAGRMGDFAVSDRSYVFNINKVEKIKRVRFKTPEEYFHLDKKPTIHNISGQRKNFTEEKLAEFTWGGIYPYSGQKTKKLKIPKETKIIFLIGPPNSGQMAFCNLHGLKPAMSPKEAEQFIKEGHTVVVGAINKTAQEPMKKLGAWLNVLIDISADEYCHWVSQKLFSHHVQENKLLRQQGDASSRILSVTGMETSKKEYSITDYTDFRRRCSWVGEIKKWRPEIIGGLMYDPPNWNPNWHVQKS